MRTYHIFHYKYPRLGLDVIHQELEVADWQSIDVVAPKPVGAFVYDKGEQCWFNIRAIHQNKPGSKFSIVTSVGAVKVPAQGVPADIRAHMMLLM